MYHTVVPYGTGSSTVSLTRIVNSCADPFYCHSQHLPFPTPIAFGLESFNSHMSELFSVPYPGSGAFLTHGSGMEKFLIRDPI
jgi:hypothetical protein